jgi:hypothetical protein
MSLALRPTDPKRKEKTSEAIGTSDVFFTLTRSMDCS